VKPQDPSIANVTPTAMAPPAGSVFATEVPVCVSKAACPRPKPGSAAWFAIQYVKRLKIMTPNRIVSSSRLRVPSAFHTAE